MVGQHDAKKQKMFWILYPSTDWYGLGYIYFVFETLIYDGKRVYQLALLFTIY